MKKLFLPLLVIVSLVSCKKDDTPETPSNPTTPTTPTKLYTVGAGITDVDGNTYKTIIITTSGSKSSSSEQEWMAENLKTTKYANGTNIELQNMVVCNSDSSTIDSLGFLYNWTAIMNNSTTSGAQGACPNGWHVPTVADYNALITAIGGTAVAGKKMKSKNATYWNDISLSDNTSGLNVHGGGWRSYMGMDFLYKQSTMLWTSTEDGANATIFQLNGNSENIVTAGTNKGTFVSCRCIKD